MTPKSRFSGFSLLEIMVIIAVAVILAAYLFPVFSNARSLSKRRNCQVNLKEIAFAIQSYEHDNDRTLPLTLGNEAPGSAGYGWAGAIAGYLPRNTALQCSNVTHRFSNQTDSPNYTTYFFNSNLSNVSLTHIKSPRHTILNGDGIPGDATNHNDGGDAPGGVAMLTPSSIVHLQGANYSFVDGHIAWLKPNRVKSGATPAAKANASFGL